MTVVVDLPEGWTLEHGEAEPTGYRATRVNPVTGFLVEQVGATPDELVRRCRDYDAFVLSRAVR